MLGLSFSPAIAGGTLATIAGVLGALAVGAYILKMRRRRFEVPFSSLWHRVLKEKESTSLWRHLRRILSMLLQLLIIALLLFAVLNPKLGTASADGKNVVIIIDASASMKTADAINDDDKNPPPTDAQVIQILQAMAVGSRSTTIGDKEFKWPRREYAEDEAKRVKVAQKLLIEYNSKDPAKVKKVFMAARTMVESAVNAGNSRLEKAKQKAVKILDSMGGADVAMILKMDGQSTPLGRFSADKAKLKKEVARVSASDTPADLHRALSAATDALRERDNPMIILIGDGAYPEQVLRLVSWKKPKPIVVDTTELGEAQVREILMKIERGQYFGDPKEAKAAVAALNAKKAGALDQARDIAFAASPKYLWPNPKKLEKLLTWLTEVINGPYDDKTRTTAKQASDKLTVKGKKDRVALYSALEVLRLAKPTSKFKKAGALQNFARGFWHGVSGEATRAGKNLAEIRLGGIDVRYVPVGSSGDNAGIVAFSVRRYVTNKLSYEVFLEIQNFGDKPVRRQVLVCDGDPPCEEGNDNTTVIYRSKEPITIGAYREPSEGISSTKDSKYDNPVRILIPNLSGAADHRLTATVRTVDGGHDLFPLDDVAHALIPKRTKQRVLLVTKDNLYLEGAMLVYDNIEVDKITPKEWKKFIKSYVVEVATGRLQRYSAMVFDDFTPEQLPPPDVHLVYFNPQGEHSPVKIVGSLKDDPRITDVNKYHMVTKWITMSDAHFDRVSVFGVNRHKGETTLVKSIRAPIIVAKKVRVTNRRPRKIVAFGFSLLGTDLTLRVAFPLMLVNVLDWFSGDTADLISSYETGQLFRVRMDNTFDIKEVTVTNPSGYRHQAPVTEGRAIFYGSQVGFHQLTALECQDKGPRGKPKALKDCAANRRKVVSQIEVASNLSNPVESRIVPEEKLLLGGTELEKPGKFKKSFQSAIWLYIVLLVLGLLLLEWLTYNRRVTV